MKAFSPSCLCLGAVLLSGCEAPEGMRYKMTASAPATTSLGQAYSDIAGEVFSDTMDIIAMDRYRHGIRPPLDTIPVASAEEDVSFDKYQSLYFKVYKVEIVDEYDAPVPLDYSKHLPVDPIDAVHSWAGRLRPTGGLNKLQVVIKDAHVQDKQNDSANKHYDAGLTIEMRICSRDGAVLASVSSVSVQSADIDGKAGNDARKAALNEALLKLIDQVNGDLEHKIAKNFSPYIDHDKAG